MKTRRKKCFGRSRITSGLSRSKTSLSRSFRTSVGPIRTSSTGNSFSVLHFPPPPPPFSHLFLNQPSLLPFSYRFRRFSSFFSQRRLKVDTRQHRPPLNVRKTFGKVGSRLLRGEINGSMIGLRRLGPPGDNTTLSFTVFEVEEHD